MCIEQCHLCTTVNFKPERGEGLEKGCYFIFKKNLSIILQIRSKICA